MTDSRPLLVSRVHTALREIAIFEADIQHAGIPAILRERTWVRFTKLIEGCRRDLRDLEQEAGNGQALDLGWNTLGEVRQRMIPLFQEGLAYIHGGVARAAGLDRGFCAIADRMLDDLSLKTDGKWDRFTILSEGEFYGDMAEIIRIRFPEPSVWNLPVAIHEFGHYLGPMLRADAPGQTYRYPFQDLFNRERARDPKYGSYFHEHFADVFATYAAGPSFLCTCAAGRFDPVFAHRDGQQHPSDAKRIYSMFWVLEKMEHPLGKVMTGLKDTWDGAVRDSLAGADLTDDEKGELEALLEEIYALVVAELPAARYDGWYPSLRLAKQVEPDQFAEPVFEKKDRIVDALNAAWISRLASPSAADAIGARAMTIINAMGTRKV